MRELKDEELELVCGGSAFASSLGLASLPLGATILRPATLAAQADALRSDAVIRLNIRQQIEDQLQSS